MSEPDLVVPATEANRAFSKLLRAAREGRRVTITSHGEPVAELVPAGEAAKAVVERARRDAAQQELLAHLRTVEPIVAGPWTREELYERDQALRIALDTNVMVYAEGVSRLPADAAKCARALLLVEKTMNETIVLPLQAAAELHNVLVRKGNASRAEAAYRVRLWCARSELVATDPAIFEDALDLSEAHRLQLFDALILAASAKAGCDLLLSEDLHDGFVWRSMTVTNPFGAQLDARIAALLGP